MFNNHENNIKYCTFQTEAYILIKLIEIQSKPQKLLISYFFLDIPQEYMFIYTEASFFNELTKREN